MLKFENIKNKIEKISVLGLGYVGLPLAVSFSLKNLSVIGFDIDEKKIQLYKSGVDVTHEVGNEKLTSANVNFTSNEHELRSARFHIISVPTPINQDKTPNLNPVIEATKLLARNLVRDSVVVYESTVYPGLTEDICIPLLEEISGLKCGVDFSVGYSPERINPGDVKHPLEKIIKIVSGYNSETLDLISKVYEIIIEVGVHRAPSIKVAEAAKVVENSQRDINIAFMNELAMVFNRMNISSKDVIDAMNTKWNALGFQPGLVGGHCIGVDPYYFIYEAEKLGFHSQLINSGRRVNDGMAKFIFDETVRLMIQAKLQILSSRIAILGITFKENCPDTRNTKVIDIYNEFLKLGVQPLITDAYASFDEVKNEYSIELVEIKDISEIDVIIIAVAHDEYINLKYKDFKTMFGNKNKKNVLVDIKNIIKDDTVKKDFNYWSL